MLPKKLNDVLRVVSPRKLAGTSYHSSIRFNALRGSSRSTSRSSRPRSISAKRPLFPESSTLLNDTSQQNDANTPEKYTIEIDAEKLDYLKIELVKVASCCDKINTDIEQSPFSAELKGILGDMIQVVRTIGTIQGNMLPTKPLPKPSFANMSYASITARVPSHNPPAKKPKRSEKPSESLEMDTGTTDDHTDDENDSKKEDEKYYRFKDAVKQAEKATLIFNLDLGKYPIMNQDTMSTRASLALSQMAAKKENANTSIPSEAAREAIDDALGMAKGISFYGKQTKTYRNKTDTENSGAFCTLPVRYDFKDRNTRSTVENTLRQHCGIKCSTPYPLVLRECMKKTVEQVKREFPGAAVRVNVDAHNFCLKVSKKMPGEAHYEFLRKHLPLPTEALEISAIKIPENFSFEVDLKPTPPPPIQTG